MGFSIYDTQTGMINRVLRDEAVPEEMAKQVIYPNEAAIEGSWDDRYFYIVDEEAVERPSVQIPEDKSIIGDDEDTFTILEVPAGTTIRVADKTYIVDDGVFEWSSTKSGVYTFAIEPPFPYCSEQFPVEVHAD